MTKLLTTLFGAAALLTTAACSSEPSDFRPNKKVSVDAVAAGTRPTGLYPSKDRPDGENAAHAGHHAGSAEAHAADASEAAATGEAVQKSAVGESATETGETPATKAAADSAAE